MPRPLPYLARRRYIAVVFAGCLVAIGIPGCRRGPNLHAITGVVRFKGQPVAGEHRVTVEKMVPPQSMPEEEFARRAAAGESIQRVPLFDTKYFSGDTTPLSAEVSESGPREFSFDIE